MQTSSKMKRIGKQLSLLVGMCIMMSQTGGYLPAQESFSLSLDEAKTLAVEQNREMQNARKDIEIANMTVTETRSIGLPQVEASAGIMNNLQLATQLIPSEFFGGAPGTFTPVSFGTQYSASFRIEASQILFSGPYIVALQTSRIYKQLAEDNLNKTALDIKQNVANTYALILATKQYIAFMERSIKNMEANLAETQKLQAAGMAESTDVDRLSITLRTLQNSLLSLNNSLKATYSMLRHQLALPATSEITLTATLEELVEQISIQQLLISNFDINNNADYQLISTQEELNKKAWQRERMEYLPSLSAFYQYSEQGLSNELSFTDWYPSEIVGVQLSVPIFNSGTKYAKSRQARLAYEKVKNNRYQTEELLQINHLQYRDNLEVAFLRYQTQKENVSLSERLYKQMEIRYKNGVISSFELTQTYDQYVDAQNRLFQSLLELIQAGVDLQKLHGEL